MKKRSRILVLILTAMLSTEPVQIVYAETAEATPVTSESTSVNPKEENADNSAVVPPKADPGWVAVEKGYQWRQEDGTLLQKSGWVTINGRKYYLHKSGIRYSGWQIYKNKKRYYLSNGDAARNRWIKYKGNYYYIRKNGTSAPKSKWLTVKGKRYYIGRKGYRHLKLSVCEKQGNLWRSILLRICPTARNSEPVSIILWAILISSHGFILLMKSLGLRSGLISLPFTCLIIIFQDAVTVLQVQLLHVPRF